MVGEDPLSAAGPYALAAVALLAWRYKVPPVVAIVREAMRFPADCLSTANLFWIAVDNLP